MKRLAPGRIDIIANSNRHPGEPEIWCRIFLHPEQGSEIVQAFFSPEEIQAAVNRVSSNRDDLAGAVGPTTLLDRFQKAMNDAIDRFKNDRR